MKSAVPVEELVKCAEREVRYRKHVYPRLIKNGRITHRKAAAEIENMEAILALLREMEASERLL